MIKKIAVPNPIAGRSAMERGVRIMRTIIITTLAALMLLLVGGNAPARADMRPELRGGVYTNADEGFIGGGLISDMSPTWYFNPNVEWVFSEGNYVTVNADIHKDLNNSGSGPAVWLGAGPAMVVTNTTNPDLTPRPGVSDTDFGLNLIGGVGAKYGSARPFGQLKYMVSDRNQLSMALGLRF
jgi:hypothetical protein